MLKHAQCLSAVFLRMTVASWERDDGCFTICLRPVGFISTAVYSSHIISCSLFIEWMTRSACQTTQPRLYVHIHGKLPSFKRQMQRQVIKKHHLSIFLNKRRRSYSILYHLEKSLPLVEFMPTSHITRDDRPAATVPFALITFQIVALSSYVVSQKHPADFVSYSWLKIAITSFSPSFAPSLAG